MNASNNDTVLQFSNNHPRADDVLLSIIVPFYHDDPVPLITALSKQADPRIELILYDDGSADEQLSQRVIKAITTAKLPTRLLTAAQNNGRSIARNRLNDAANGQYLLFLDADMLPAQATFLSNYLQQIQSDKPDIVFGGLSVSDNSVDKTFDLHRALSAGSDCLSAAQRSILPAKHVCSSNLLVRKDVLLSCPFDTGFIGWGWEDVEWAARADEKFTIVHIDNSALHLGLESTETLIRRFRDSADNYARFAARHPELAKQLPSYRTAKLAAKIPGLKLIRPVFAALARDNWHIIPMALRVFALKLWRAGWYAEKLA